MLNIHPAVVHLPIGLLTLYSVLELVRFKKILAKSYWFYIKAVLVIAGSLGTFAGALTGYIAGKEFPSELQDIHSYFAIATTVVYLVLAIAYLQRWIKMDASGWAFLKRPWINKMWQIKLKMSDFILRGWVSVLLALVGFALLIITGSLGGAMVYGPEVDPVVNFVYHLFFAE